jgi:hypothetical protein
MALHFTVKSLDLRDAATQREFLDALRKLGVPVTNCNGGSDGNAK